MKKNKWKLPAAGLAALALLLGLYGVLRATNAENEEGETEGEALTAMASEDITELAVTIDGQEAVFVREDSEWKKSGEDSFPVNKDKLDTLAETFSGLTADRELSDIEDLSYVIQAVEELSRLLQEVVTDAYQECEDYLDQRVRQIASLAGFR